MALKAGIAVVLIVAIGITAALVTVVRTDRNDFKQRCEAAGGIAFMPRDQYICLNKTAVLTVE